MRQTTCLRILGFCALLLGGSALAADSRPNIVFILADDLGWSDVAFNGSHYYKTPNIDALSKRGMVFTQAYAANPLCSPTRASLMTGQYPARIGITAPNCHLPEVRLKASIHPRGAPNQKSLIADSATRLNTNYVTIAETLKAAGYATGHFGKWHLGAEPFSPLQQGFDLDVPHCHGPGPAGSYVAPWKFPTQLHFTGKPGEHIEDRMAQEAVKFIETHRDRRFFLNYWAFSVHAPYDAKKSLVEKYRESMDLNLPQHNPVYAAMVQSLDDAVGTLVKTLEANGLMDKTIIVFFSDNGGVDWQAMKKEGKGGPDDLTKPYAEIPPTSNAPLRGGKASIYEGGTREPCFIVWPGVISPGARSEALIDSVDFYPTLAEIAGAPLPKDQVMDGSSFLPLLKGTTQKHRDLIFDFFPHNVKATGQLPSASVRKGDWKLIRYFHDGPHQENRYELYNLKDDLGEAHNLAATQPSMVRDLDALLEKFLKDTHAVVPGPNPAYRDSASRSATAGATHEWNGSKDTQLQITAGELRITSTGGDPFISTRFSGLPGPLTLEMRMKSSSQGEGKVFWLSAGKTIFGKECSVRFEPQHDGAWHDYTVTLSATNAVSALRIDPAMAKGEISFQSLRVKNAMGEVVKEWSFAPTAAKIN